MYTESAFNENQMDVAFVFCKEVSKQECGMRHEVAKIAYWEECSTSAVYCP